MEEQLQKMRLPEGGDFWLPYSASTQTDLVDKPFWLIMWVSVVMFFVVLVPMFYFAWRYRRKTPDQMAENQNDHNQILEIAWSVLPLIFFAIVFYMGFMALWR
jgi:cytochrome c oxidase subunit 2